MSKKIVITEWKQQKIDRFWKWAVRNESQFLSEIGNPGYMDALAGLRKRTRNLSSYVGWGLKFFRDEGIIQMTITVDGRKRMIPMALAIAASCPESARWQATALYQPATDLEQYRNGLDEPLEFEDFNVKVSDLRYRLEEYDIRTRKMHITVYCPQYRYHYDHPEFEELMKIALVEITGEVLYRNNLVVTGFAQLTDAHRNFSPVYKLGEKLEELRVIKRRANIALKKLLRTEA